MNLTRTSTHQHTNPLTLTIPSNPPMFLACWYNSPIYQQARNIEDFKISAAPGLVKFSRDVSGEKVRFRAFTPCQQAYCRPPADYGWFTHSEQRVASSEWRVASGKCALVCLGFSNTIRRSLVHCLSQPSQEWAPISQWICNHHASICNDTTCDLLATAPPHLANASAT
jgi:hypothetical protein